MKKKRAKWGSGKKKNSKRCTMPAPDYGWRVVITDPDGTQKVLDRSYDYAGAIEALARLDELGENATITKHLPAAAKT